MGQVLPGYLFASPKVLVDRCYDLGRSRTVPLPDREFLLTSWSFPKGAYYIDLKPYM